MHVCSIFYLYLNIFFTTYLFMLTLKQLKRDMHWQCGVWRFSLRYALSLKADGECFIFEPCT